MLDVLGKWFTSRTAVYIAWSFWILAAIVIGVLVWIDPTRHSMYYIYPDAARNWWARAPLYKPTLDEFQYPPISAILHTPFALLGTPVGDIVWRWTGVALLTWAIWRLANRFTRKDGPNLFPLVSLLIFPTALDAIQNGQVNIHICAVMMHGAVSLMQSRWNWAAFALCLAVALKPIAIVLLLLVAACYYREMLWRLAIGMVIVAVFPFLTAPPAYVVQQTVASFDKMYHCAQPDRNTFTDVHGAVWRISALLHVSPNFPPSTDSSDLSGRFGYQIDRKSYLVIQATSAFATLGLCWIAARRWKEPGRTLFLWGFAAAYLMLFNPRNEDNSYIIVTPVIALLAALLLYENRRLALGFSMVVLTLGMTCNGWGNIAHYYLTPWGKPLLCVIFVAVFCRELFTRPQPWGEDEVASRAQIPASAPIGQ